jgi:hypothetical protein
MLTTTGTLLIGGSAALLAALLEGSGALAHETPDLLIFLGATVALALARRPARH